MATRIIVVVTALVCSCRQGSETPAPLAGGPGGGGGSGGTGGSSPGSDGGSVSPTSDGGGMSGGGDAGSDGRPPVACGTPRPLPRWTSVHIDTFKTSFVAPATIVLALDRAGKPRVAYHNEGRVEYAWPESIDASGAVWSSVRLRPLVESSDFASPGGVALDAADQPRLVFIEGRWGSLLRVGYFEWDGSLDHMPTYELVNNQAIPSLTTRFALADGGGAPAIAFIGNGSIRYAHKPAATWIIEDTRVTTAQPLIGGNNGDGHHPFFALARAFGESAVATVNHKRLDVSIRKNEVWSPEKVVDRTDGKLVFHPVLHFDDSGTLHLFYVLSGVGLRYARRIDGRWEDSAVMDAALDADRIPGLRLLATVGKDGRLHVLFGNTYFRHDGCRWEMAQVRLDEGASLFPAIMAMVLDAAGEPHLAYFTNLQDGRLQYRYAYPVAGP